MVSSPEGLSFDTQRIIWLEGTHLRENHAFFRMSGPDEHGSLISYFNTNSTMSIPNLDESSKAIFGISYMSEIKMNLAE